MKKIALLLLIVALFTVGCAPKVVIRAPESLLSENNMNRVAVFGEGKVVWPRMGKGGLVISVPDSKHATESVLSHTNDALKARGYDVIRSEAVGVGYYSRNWWLIDEENPELEQIKDNNPIFIYPEFREEGELNEAVHNLIKEIELSIVERRIDSFVPPGEDIASIHVITGADTICVNRVFGRKFSNARKTAAFLAGMLSPAAAGATAGVQDMIESYLVFIDAKTGEVMWQHGEMVMADPLSPDKAFTEKVLRFFPPHDNSMDQSACLTKGGFIYCK